MQDKSRLDNQRGIDKEIQAKILAKFDKNKARKCLEWIAAVTGKEVKFTDNIVDDFAIQLKDGYLLGLLVKKIGGKDFKKSKWKKTKLPFPAREQIQKFVSYCKKLGMKATDVCTPNDLFDGDNLNNVINHLYALNALAQKHGFKGATIDGSNMKFAKENKRNFSEETLRKGRNIIPVLTQLDKDHELEAKSNHDSAGIVKTNLKSVGGAVPMINRGGEKPDHSDYDAIGIVKTKTLHKSVAANSVPILNQGSEQIKAEKGFDAMGIVKLNTKPASGAVPIANQGGVKIEADKGFDAMGIVKVKPDGTLVSKKV